MIASTEGKGLGRTRSGDWQEEDRKEITEKCGKNKDDVKTAEVRYCGFSYSLWPRRPTIGMANSVGSKREIGTPRVSLGRPFVISPCF
jgi:hypothetical protein